MINFLRDVPPVSIMPVSDMLVSRRYTFGDIIIAKGQVLDKFGIISEGNCHVIDEIRIKRDIRSLLDRRPSAPLK